MSEVGQFRRANPPDPLVDLGDRLGDSPGLPVTAREIGTYTAAATAFSRIGADRSVQGLRFSTVSPLDAEDGDEQRGGKFPRVPTMPKSLWSADRYT